jgi:hypothetical protein
VNAQTYGGRFRGLWSPEAFLGRKYQVKSYPLRVEILVIKIRPKDTVVRVGVPIR